MTFEDSREDAQISFLSRLLQFSQLLRREGLGITPAESLDMSKAVSLVGVFSMENFREALRATLVKKSEDNPRFDFLFQKFWLTPITAGIPLGKIPLTKYEIPKGANPFETLGNRIESKNSSGARTPDSLTKAFAAYSPLERRSRKSFAELNPTADRLLLKRGAKNFARATATLPGRRHSFSKGAEPDFRKTLRNNLKTGGNGVKIELRSRKITKARIVILADISGSMDAYSEEILKLLYYVVNTISGSTIFGFSTRVVPLNRFLQGRSLREASQLISKNVEIWSSGTRIGAALKELLLIYTGVFRSSTVFVVLSDGWELGDLQIFHEELREIRRRVSKLVWLNPQADSLDYEPLAEGMKIALPLVDLFAGFDAFIDKQKLTAALRKNTRHRMIAD